MLRFSFLEDQGVSVAAFSGKPEGDCSLRGITTPPWGRDVVSRLCGVASSDIVLPSQVHGAVVRVVDKRHQGFGAGAGHPELNGVDGLLTNVSGVPIGILTADCVPLFLFDPRKRVVGIIHAGRQGTLARIAQRAVEVMEKTWSSSPEDILAVIGPSACPDCYEVSEAIAEDWEREGMPLRGRYLDLWGANVKQLEEKGIQRNHIEVACICTIADTQWFSYRREKTTARNLALLML
ncbi:MAG TPA: peptidoglycan editing factor PgeF [Candidatus Hydrogenedentes bacterium]|nr:peptidoglycan editing factor PgeF [Candidatus Hydrogenedentota bacterium]HOL77563.1 peptidoglycan editing factor PgeF [Candidatus Hydrogenedentota bacterium]HPO84868.1 peptidoglycan editing factor PgeF [Candidatus Hydrogenedentota bacterium]